MLSVKPQYCLYGLIVFALLCSVDGVALAQSGSRSGLGGMGGGGPAPPGPDKRKRYVPPKFAPAGKRIPVAEVRLTGNFTVSESRVRSKLQTRAGRPFDPAAVQADKRQLLSSGLCYEVRVLKEESPNGVIITYELFEQPIIQHIEFIGNSVRKKTLLKKAEIEVGQPLSRFRVEEAKRKLEEFYKGRGNSHVEIKVQQGNERTDKGVVFQIKEGPRQRVRWTKFEGNSIASDARLRTQIDSKPGILWLFKGQVDQGVIDEDVDKLTSYYRSLGFFKAKVTKELQFDQKQQWLTLTFHIDEGPRYVIRNIQVEGNDVFNGNSLLAATKLRQGDFFDLGKMNGDVRVLKDTYGANGYIKVEVEATPQFDEQPGQLDLIYKIAEGKQHRVGNIHVNLGGEYPHTRETVVLNRMELREGDIIDIRKLRAAETRLTRSQLFESGPMGGPEIAVRPHDPDKRYATRPQRNQY